MLVSLKGSHYTGTYSEDVLQAFYFYWTDKATVFFLLSLPPCQQTACPHAGWGMRALIGCLSKLKHALIPDADTEQAACESIWPGMWPGQILEPVLASGPCALCPGRFTEYEYIVGRRTSGGSLPRCEARRVV